MVHESNTNVFYTTATEVGEIMDRDPTMSEFNFGDRLYCVDAGMWFVVGGENGINEYRSPRQFDPTEVGG